MKPPIVPKPGDWAARFALKRRAIDRAILAEAERTIDRQIELEAMTLAQEAPKAKSGLTYQTEREKARAAIARAFGRPLR